MAKSILLDRNDADDVQPIDDTRSYRSIEALMDTPDVHQAIDWDREFARAAPQEHAGHWGIGTMYAIAFDLDTDTLAKAYPTQSSNNAYADIRKRLVTKHGFSWQQGSVYFGGPDVNAVTCVMAVIDLTNTFSWFAASVRDIRMLRIEEQNDLAPAIKQALAAQSKSKSE
jgi:virulence-associated protein VapD